MAQQCSRILACKSRRIKGQPREVRPSLQASAPIYRVMRGAAAVHVPTQLAKPVTASEEKTSRAHAHSIDEPNPQPMSRLPAHARNVLQIEVPVTVTLASDRLTVSRILELAPGTLLQFRKPCDEPLTLSVGDCDLAVGTAVTVGERLGLCITSMVVPEANSSH